MAELPEIPRMPAPVYETCGAPVYANGQHRGQCVRDRGHSPDTTPCRAANEPACWNCRDYGLVVVAAYDESAGISPAQMPTRTVPCPEGCEAAGRRTDHTS